MRIIYYAQSKILEKQQVMKVDFSELIVDRLCDI